uniref:Vitellogenin n=1 Tax=Acrobeloides nanus TaxID=290746 RepID=A0A914CNF1_9BILA
MALRPTILLGLLCAALAANLSPSLLRGYRAGHHYSYDFDGQIASSLSNAEDYSTIRIRSQVNFDFLNDKIVLVKLERPELGTLNGFLDQPERIHSFQKFEQLDVKPEHISQLDLPFEMRYDNGQISDIKFHRGDSVWSENIKRSIVNLLQVQLEAPNDDSRSYQPSYFYQTNETTIEGECETTYHIQKLDDSDYESVEENKPSVNITKTVNFEKCQRRPELRYNYYRHSEPLDWNSQSGKSQSNEQQKKKQAIEPVVDSISQYEMSLENDIVQTSKVVSKYSYDMVDKDHVSLTTFTVGQLVAKNSEKRTAPENDFSKKTAQSLMHSNEFDLMKERFITEGDEEYLKQNPYLRLDNAGEVVKNIMRRLVKSSIGKEGAEGIEEDATRQFTHLVAILRLCSKNDIQQIHKELFMSTDFDDKSQQFVKEILADALAVAGTKNTIDHLVEKIEAAEISSSKAARTLEKLYKLRLTSAEMIKPIWKLCEKEVARKNENLKRSCYLAWSAMVNAMCGHDHEHEHDHEKWAIASSNKQICPSSLKQQLVQDVMQLYQQSNLKADKILALKTLGNMGIDQSIDQLDKIITDKSEDRLVRIHAIDALRNLRDQVPQKVQRLLTPVFRDRRERPEVRMNAFQELLQTRPDSALLHLLVADMTHETNVDVKSFVVSSLKRLAENSDNLLDEQTAKAVKSSLLLLEQMDESILRQSASKKHQIGYFSDPSNWHEFGSLLTFASIFSNDSYLPKEIMASLDKMMDGRLIQNNWQLGVHMQELEQLTARLAQNIESKGFDDIIIRGRRSLASEYNPVEMLKSLFNKLQLVARQRSSSDAEPMLLFYRRHNNLDYSFLLLDEASLPEILKKFILEGRLDVSALEENNLMIRTNGAMYDFENQMKLPTTMGIPMVITSRMATIAFVDGKYSLSFGNNEKVRDAKVELEVHPQIATSVIVKMEVFSPLFTSGVKTIHSFQGRLPLNMNVEIKSPNVVPTISWRLPEQETRLFHLQSRPITFVRVWPQKSNVFIDAKEKTLLIPKLERLHTTKDFEAECPFTGMQYAIEGHGYRRSFSDFDWMLSGENAFAIKIKPTSNTAKVVRLSGERLTLRDSISTKQQLEKIFEQQPALFQNQDQKEIQALQDYIRRSNSKLTQFQKTVLKLETSEGQNRNAITLDLKLACNENAYMCLFEKDVKVDFENGWTWKTIGQLARPELQNIYANVKSGHMVGKIESSWGSEEKNTVTLNIYGKPSERRINQFKSLLNKNIAVSDNFERENMLDEKFEQLPSMLKPNEYSMAIEHQVTDKTIQTIVPFYNWMKACPKTSIYIPDSSKVDSAISRRHSTLMAQLTYDSYINLTLTTPEERMEVLNWDSEPRLSRNPKTIVDLFASSHDNYAKCTYKREQIETFDGQTIDIPLTTCYTLLAKDCGDESNPKFGLMAKKMSKRSKDLKIKFITQKKSFELHKDETSGDMVIKVNDIIIRKDEYDQYNIRKIESSELTIYELKCPHAQTILRFDGQKIIIKIADMYMNRQCGVCGHMNNDREDDFLKHDNTQAESAQDFQLSYLYRVSDECDPSVVRELEAMKPKSRRRLDVEYNFDNEEKDRETRNPIKKTITVEKRNEVCFSLKPVNACPKGFENADSEGKQEEVNFACFARSSTDAQRYLREARENVLALDDESQDYTEKVTVPRRCIKY